jgi:kinesin family protein 4/21/27
MADECKTHLSELSDRRSQLSRIDEGKSRERDSLMAANQQVAALKAQLEKAVEGTVDKKMGSRLKVSKR